MTESQGPQEEFYVVNIDGKLVPAASIPRIDHLASPLATPLTTTSAGATFTLRLTMASLSLLPACLLVICLSRSGRSHLLVLLNVAWQWRRRGAAQQGTASPTKRKKTPNRKKTRSAADTTATITASNTTAIAAAVATAADNGDDRAAVVEPEVPAPPEESVHAELSAADEVPIFVEEPIEAEVPAPTEVTAAAAASPVHEADPREDSFRAATAVDSERSESRPQAREGARPPRAAHSPCARLGAADAVLRMSLSPALRRSVRTLEAEAAKLPPDECVVCLDEPSTHLFVPCGHQCVCFSCGSLMDACPKCRATVTLLLRVYR